MANKIITLKHGIKIDDQLYQTVELRDLTAGDVIEAEEQAEKLYFGPGNIPFVVSSPIKAIAYTLPKLIVKFGDLPIPLPKNVLETLHVEDFNQLTKIYQQMRGETDLAEAGRTD